MRYAVVALMLLVMSGCGTPLGLNFQRASLRGTSDMSTTAVLEYTPEKEVTKKQEQIKKYAQDLLNFIGTGQVAKLPVNDLERELKKIVPDEFDFLVDGVIGYIVSQTVDVSGAIGEDNVKRIKAGLIGIITGAEKYDLNDREKEAEPIGT